MKHQHTIRRCQSEADFKLAATFVDAWHSYIDWADRPSRKLYWLLFEDGNLVGVFGLGSAFSRPKAVAAFMGAHGLKFNEVGNNIVYCLAGHQDKNAGSKLLSLCRKDAAVWWQARYGDRLRAFQTFILPPRTGAVYKADNWALIGETTGKTQSTKTVTEAEAERLRAEGLSVQRRVFRNGQVRFTYRTYADTPPKLIFMRLV